MTTDPVCGMTVDPATAKFHAVHAGREFHFCSARCREKFVADPAKYLAPEPAATVAPKGAGTIYTCPMHPQIRQDHPGACPICGMALEPMLPTADDDNPELRDFSRRFCWTLPLSLMVLALAMFGAMQSMIDAGIRT
jgi:Cu+-exporting ATPase